MNKKIFGIKIGTILTWALCLVVALCMWIYVEYANASETTPGDGSSYVES